MNVVSLLIAAIVAFIAKLVMEAIGVPEPWSWIVALLAFVLIAFGDRLRGGTWR